jgi:peptide deformylase
MAIREIRILGDPVLRQPAEEVLEFDAELREFVEDMLATMYHANGIGLAAPQVGVSRRVLVVDPGEGDDGGFGAIALVNPKVTEMSSETDRAAEGCLSIPGMEEVVERPVSVTIEGFGPDGSPLHLEVDGLLSRALQHEIDHLDGILFFDRISPLKRRMFIKKWRKNRVGKEAL